MIYLFQTILLLYFEELVLTGHVYILETPLFRVRNKSKTVYCYSEESRDKEIAKMGEDAKVAVRAARRDAMDKLKSMKKKSEITEDDQKQGEKKIQDITDKHIKNIEQLTEKKQKQIMEI